MRLIQQITDDAMIVDFLRAEFHSPRFGSSIRTALGEHDVSIVTLPDLSKDEDNRYRRWLLGEVRGYGQNRELFEDFPSEVKWYTAMFSKEELKSVMYIDYSYWNELSKQTRHPIDAAQNVLDGVEIYGVKNDGFREIHAFIREGKQLPRMIFVAANVNSRVVVLEGHARLTAYFMDTEYIPQELEVIIGLSEDFIRWGLY